MISGKFLQSMRDPAGKHTVSRSELRSSARFFYRAWQGSGESEKLPCASLRVHLSARDWLLSALVGRIRRSASERGRRESPRSRRPCKGNTITSFPISFGAGRRSAGGTAAESTIEREKLAARQRHDLMPDAMPSLCWDGPGSGIRFGARGNCHSVPRNAANMPSRSIAWSGCVPLLRIKGFRRYRRLRSLRPVGAPLSATTAFKFGRKSRSGPTTGVRETGVDPGA